MTRIKENNMEAEVEIQSPIVEETERNTIKDKEQIAEVVVTTEVKKVKIQAVEEISCIIAGKPYRLQKDKQHLVPTDVAAILCYSKKAYRV